MVQCTELSSILHSLRDNDLLSSLITHHTVSYQQSVRNATERTWLLFIGLSCLCFIKSNSAYHFPSLSKPSSHSEKKPENVSSIIHLVFDLFLIGCHKPSNLSNDGVFLRVFLVKGRTVDICILLLSLIFQVECSLFCICFI